MSGRLRHIALTVELVTGGYAWLIFESRASKLHVLERGATPYRTYLQALQAGYEELALLSACGLHERGIEKQPDIADAAAAQTREEREMVEFE